MDFRLQLCDGRHLDHTTNFDTIEGFIDWLSKQTWIKINDGSYTKEFVNVDSISSVREVSDWEEFN